MLRQIESPNIIETIINHRPVYIDLDGNIHRQLKTCYSPDSNCPYLIKPLLIYTVEEFTALIETSTLIPVFEDWKKSYEE